MKRIIVLVLACLLLLSACGRRLNNVVVSGKKTEETEPVKYFGGEEDGYCLTYPSTFTQTFQQKSPETYTFTEENSSGGEQSIILSIEDNDHEGMSVSDYPQALELTDNMNILSDNSFDSETYDSENDTSLYTICTITDDKIYKVEYTYSGTEAPKEKDALSLQVYDDFTADTLMAYATANLEDLYGTSENLIIEYTDTSQINGYDLSVFRVTRNNAKDALQNNENPEGVEFIANVAVNTSGVCYVNQNEETGEYVNIELLTSQSDKTPESWARYYFEEHYGTMASELTFTQEEDTLRQETENGDDIELTVFAVSNGIEELCRIGVTADGLGFLYDSENDVFVRIDK